MKPEKQFSMCATTPTFSTERPVGRAGMYIKMLMVALLALNGSGVNAAEELRLEEVIVTAEKRETSLQDTPIAMSAFSGEGLEEAQITNAMDLQMAVPNMTMSQTFQGSNISIRGIGNNAISSAADSGTGVHFNGVYLKSSAIFESEFYDTERVEVLRGPQGTLYGRNTTAGVINIISNKPVDTFGGDVQLQLGDYSSVKSKGAVNIPLTDTLWQRFSGFYLNRDGYSDSEDNVNGGAKQYIGDVDGRDMYSLRSSTRWLLADATEATLVVNFFKEDSDRLPAGGARCNKDPDGILGCLPGSLGNETPNSAATGTGSANQLLGSLLGLDFPSDDYAQSVNSNDLRKVQLTQKPDYSVEETIVSLEVNHDFDEYKFTALGGYQHLEGQSFGAATGTLAVPSEPWPLEVTVDTNHGSFTDDYTQSIESTDDDSDQWSLETRLASDYDGDVQFLLGAFYLDYSVDSNFSVYASTFELLGEVLGFPPELTTFEVDERPFELESWAVFGELYYDFNERTEMTFGLRYTYEEKSNRSRTVFLDQLDDPTSPDGGYTDFNDDWDEVTGKYNITYHLQDDVMAYGTLARSYKSGGFNPISSESPLLEADPSLEDFDPEYINSIEVGLKSRLFQDTLQLNLSYFYYDYEGMQIAKFVEAVTLNENVDATIQGIEAEFLYALDNHWLFGLDAAWLDTEINDFSTTDPTNPNQMGTTEFVVSAFNGTNTTPELCGEGCQGIEADLDGNEIPNSPQFSVNLTASYTWDFSSGMSLRFGTNYYWQDKMYTRTFNTAQDKLDNWKVWNANAILTSSNDSWWVEAWIRNINDDDYITGQFQTGAVSGLGVSYFLLEPRTYGATVGYKF